MKNLIYWFSATGNSLAAAKKLADGLGAAEIRSMAGRQGSVEIPEGTETLGLVFPVYGFGLPCLVAQFIKHLNVRAGVYVYAVATCGGEPGATLLQLDRLLKKRGSRLDYGTWLAFPGNCIYLYPGPKADVVNTILNAAMARMERETLPNLQARKTGVIESGVFFMRWLSPLIYFGFSKSAGCSDKKFWVTEACTKCGLCARVCPVNNIRCEAGKTPEWLHHCEQCMACINYCPVEAIQQGWLTKGRRRYRHPQIQVAELIAQKTSDPAKA